jgi:hypothetical protein
MWDDGAASDAHHLLGAQGPGGMLVLLVLFALTAVAAAMIASAMARQAESVRRANSRKAIFEKVEKALLVARAVNGPAQVPAVENLVRVLDEHLKPAFMLAGGLNDPAGGLRKALGGRITDPKPAAPPALPVAVAGGTSPIVIVTGNSAPTGGAASAVASAGGGVSASVSGGGSDVGVIAPAQIFSLPPAGKAPEASVPTAPVERDMSWKERQDAVQRSLDTFSAFWKRDTVDELLKGAQKALCDVKLPPRLPPGPPGR